MLDYTHGKLKEVNVNDYVGKTIKAIDSGSHNVWLIEFTDGTSICIEPTNDLGLVASTEFK